MDTSIQYGSEGRHLQIHAKQRVFFDKLCYLKMHGKLNTHTGVVNGNLQLKKIYKPGEHTFVDIGIGYDTEVKDVTCDIQGKSKLPIVQANSGTLYLDTRGGYNLNTRDKTGAPRGSVEVAYDMINFQGDQDMRFKVGYDLTKKIPYFKFRENNWSLTADTNGTWRIKYDL